MIIPYQEIIGNYSEKRCLFCGHTIIPYQEIIGNYSDSGHDWIEDVIIPYQEIIGNYSFVAIEHNLFSLYHTKK